MCLCVRVFAYLRVYQSLCVRGCACVCVRFRVHWLDWVWLQAFYATLPCTVHTQYGPKCPMHCLVRWHTVANGLVVVVCPCKFDIIIVKLN